MSASSVQKKPQAQPVFHGGILPIDPPRVSIDIVAGVTLAAPGDPRG